MRCEKCGAAADDGATFCAECGEPLAAPAAGSNADAPLYVSVARTPRKRPKWLAPALGVLVLLLIAGGAYLLWPKATVLPGPAGAAQRMMQAFAAYDAAAILENATHSSMTATDVAAFTKQAEDAKKLANGQPGLKDLTILKTTIDPTDKSKAVVQLSAQWLTDQAKGTYTLRTETITVVYKDGKWQVQLFQ
jgi:hypothetical protein